MISIENGEQALILIDANGKYDLKKGIHLANASAMVDEEFYDTLIKEIQSGSYTEIIYSINLPNCNKKEDIDKAMEADPVLSQISEDYRKKIKVFKHGFGLAQEFDDTSKLIELENKLAEKGYHFVLAGLYYDWCVETHEKNLRNRCHNVHTSRPQYLSRWSSTRAKERGSLPLPSTKQNLTLQQIGEKTTRDFSSNPEQASKAFETLETGVRTQEEIKEGQTQGEE